jgi:GNAT superfamily N-acetyltransferase
MSGSWCWPCEPESRAYYRGMSASHPPPRRAAVGDAAEAARLLHDFNTEFQTPSPGVGVLSARLRDLLALDSTFAILAGSPSLGVALVTLRRNVWYDGPVALLDELYVVPPARGRGIGASMLDLVVSLACDVDAELMEINVDEGDAGARRFYERHGFTAVEPDTGEHALYYSRALVR